MKFWNAHNHKVFETVSTETLTCVDVTGMGRYNDQTKMLIVAGCHTGNLFVMRAITSVERV
jgi:hypothetical protein